MMIRMSSAPNVRIPIIMYPSKRAAIPREANVRMVVITVRPRVRTSLCIIVRREQLKVGIHYITVLEFFVLEPVVHEHIKEVNFSGG